MTHQKEKTLSAVLMLKMKAWNTTEVAKRHEQGRALQRPRKQQLEPAGA